VASSSDGEKAERHNQMDAKRAMNALLDLFAALEDVSQTIQTQVRL
jgi:hypothetical protein